VKRIRLDAGQKAPFAGVLLSNAAEAKLITDRKAEVNRLKLRIQLLEDRQKELVDNERTLCTVKLETASKKLKLIEDTCKTKEKILHGAVDRTAKSCDRSWYESPYFNFAMGAIVFGGVSAGVTYAGTK
jgi:hypothetical protein